MIFQFDDRLKQNFENHRLRTARPVVKAFLIIVGLVNLLLLIPDCINATSETIRLIVALRVGYALLTVAFYLLLKRFTTFRSLALGITLMEAIAVAQFLLVFASYPSPNFMIQLLGMIVLVVFLFFAPNYWPLMLGITLFGSAAFILMAYGIFAHDPAVQLVPGMRPSRPPMLRMSCGSFGSNWPSGRMATSACPSCASSLPCSCAWWKPCSTP